MASTIPIRKPSLAESLERQRLEHRELHVMAVLRALRSDSVHDPRLRTRTPRQLKRAIEDFEGQHRAIRVRINQLDD